uniref:Secreted protein n=1 Tax=Octopus bimaculoides TaxID=37653 RepID=A0A0L8HNC4_OCTBM
MLLSMFFLLLFMYMCNFTHTHYKHIDVMVDVCRVWCLNGLYYFKPASKGSIIRGEASTKESNFIQSRLLDEQSPCGI